MRLLLLFIMLLSAVPAAAQQPLILDRGIAVDHDLSPINRFDRSSYQSIHHCYAKDFRETCARIFWDVEQPLTTHRTYAADVDAVVRLSGPGPDLHFEPFVRCMVRAPRGLGVDYSGPGRGCMTRLDYPNLTLEWGVGGRVLEENITVPGLYTGFVSLRVEHGEATWALAVPVEYEVHERLSVCSASISGGGTLYLGMLPAGLGGTVVIPIDGTSYVKDHRCTTAPPEVKDESALGNEMCHEEYPSSAYSDPGSYVTVLVTPAADTRNTELAIDAWADVNLTGGEGSLAFSPQLGHWDGSDWQPSDLGPNYTSLPVPLTGRIEYRLGGEMSIPASASPGTYTGTWSIRVGCI